MIIHKRFFGVLSCFFFLLFTPINNDSLAACGSDPNADSVKVAGYAYTSTSIQDAYNYASTTLNLPSFTLQLAGQIFTEDLVIDGGAVVIDGGWDCSFATKTSPSSLFGTITITSTGLLIATANTEAPRVVSTDQTSFDRDGDGFTSIGSTSGSADDCNDNVFAINPGAVEICDGLDNNCDGQTDEGLTGTDVDGDGYFAIGSCGAIANDCNDNNAAINPGALDVPYDGIDQDCSGADLTFANGNACADCHVPDDALDSVHNYRSVNTATDSSCVLCHAGPVNSTLSGHYGKTVRTTDNGVAAGSTINCWTCHDNSNHSGGFPLGDGNGDVWNDVAPPYPFQYTCDNCHANRSARHATATAHNNRVIDSTCGNCHTSDTTALGSPGNGSLASAADVDALHGVAQATDCAICHAYSGTLMDASVVRQTISQGLSGTQISCLNCHTDKGTNHGNFAHPIEVGPNDLSYNPGQLCSACHVVANWAEIEGTEHNVATNGAGSCATCHNSTRPDVMAAITAAANPTHCLDCHADKNLTPHGSVDHVALGHVTGGTTFCLDCHDPGTAANATVDVTHNGTCNLCHTTVPNLQPGVPAGGGDCVTCHSPNASVTWEVIHLTNPPSHASLVQVPATGCADCHDNTLVSAAAETHNGCTSCHDADTGALVSLAIGQGFTPGGDCTTCHMDSWEVTHTTNMPSHGSLVQVYATSCGDCHDDTLISAAANTHNGCATCHNSDDGRLVTTNSTNQQSFVTGGNCTNCHGDYFSNHAHHNNATNNVSYNDAVDTSQATQQGCAICHDDNGGALASWTDIYVEHLSDCANCHSYTGSASAPLLDVQTAISSGSPATCATCHTDKVPATDHGVDHVASGYVTIEAGCTVCHPDPSTTFTSSGNNKVHDGCTTCHDATTNALINLAAGHEGGPNVCTTCHTDRVWTDHSIDHQAAGYVTLHSECTSCHATTLTAGQGFISPADDEKHNACTSCHAADGSQPTGSGDCSMCHSGVTGDWTTHAEDHTTKVTSATGCASCHSATVDYAAFVDPTSNLKHDDCYVCHSAATKLANAAAGDCSQCHAGVVGDFTTHTTQDHTTKVTQQTECSGCHTETVDYVNFIDGANDKKHDSCATCHNATTNAPVATAGNCAQCHTPNYFDGHTHSHTVALGAGDLSNGTSCGNCHVVANWAEINGTEHNVATNGAGSCATCHNSPTQTVINVIAAGAATNCLDCHTDKTAAHGSPDHIAGLVTLTSPCADCHDPGSAANATVEVTHSGNCSLCHTASIPDLQSGLQAGNCATCHGSNVQTVHPNCSTCHGEPPSGTSAPNRDNAHSEHNVLGYGSVTPSCAACHNNASHYDGSTQVSISSSFDDKDSGTPSFNGSTCSNTRCHGGQTTPSWSTGSLNVNTQCTSCHQDRWRESDQYNSYYSGEHDKHVRGEGYACTECHSISKLATGHFSNLQTTAFELPPGSTIGGSDTTIGSRWNDSSNTCSNLSCHGKYHDSRDNW